MPCNQICIKLKLCFRLVEETDVKNLHDSYEFPAQCPRYGYDLP